MACYLPICRVVKKTLRRISAAIALPIRYADRAPYWPSMSARPLLRFLLVTLRDVLPCHQDRQFPSLSLLRPQRILQVQRMSRVLQTLRLQSRKPPRPRLPPRRREHAIITSSVAIGTSIHTPQPTVIIDQTTIPITIKADTLAFGKVEADVVR